MSAKAPRTCGGCQYFIKWKKDKFGGGQMCIFHKYIRVEEVDHSLCGNCFEQPKRWWPPERLVEYPKGYCPHSIKVCIKCGKVEGYGSHGRIREIPQSCLSQVIKMLDDFDVPWNR